MKIAAKQIEPFVKSPLNVLGALIYGPDRGLVRQRVDQIASAVLSDLNDPFNRVDLSGEALLDDSARLADELAAMSFTGDQRLIIVREATDKVAAIIDGALPYANKSNYLLVYAEELTARSPLRALFEKAPQLAAVPCYKDDGYGLEQLIVQTLTGYGFRANKEIIAYLANNLNGDRMVVLSELEKLSLYCDGEEQLSMEMVAELFENQGEKSLDDLANAVASRQPATYGRVIDTLLLEGQQPIVMIRSLHRYFSCLAEVQRHIQQGKSPDQAISSLRPPVFFKQKPLIHRHVSLWSSAHIDQVLHRLMRLESEMKKHSDYGTELFKQQLLLLSRPLTMAA